MSDKITTLHLKNDPSTNIYPNVKIENIPIDESITRDGENLVRTKTIYDFTHLNFLSLNGGTMKGNIATGGFASPEEAVLGDGLDVSDLSSQSEPVTHYGCGYIRQDDDEDASIKYQYNFPKKSGTLALTEDLENYATKKDFDDLKSIIYNLHSITYNPYEFSYLTSSIIPNEVDGRKVVGGSYAIMDWVGGNSVEFNQLANRYNLYDPNGLTIAQSGNGRFVLNGTTTALTTIYFILTVTQNHKYLLKTNQSAPTDYSKFRYRINNVYVYDSAILTPTASGSVTIDIKEGVTFDNVEFVINIHDLTLMGLDNITSVEEFKALFPLDYYPYNAGEIKSTILNKIESYSTKGVKLGEINIPNAPLRLEGNNDIHDTLTFEEQSNGTYNAILTKKVGVETPTTETIATGLSFDDTNFKIEKGGSIKAIYDEVPPTISVNFMTKGE